MRSFALALTLVLGSTCLARQAHATSCGPAPWEVYRPFEDIAVPTDFRPWMMTECYALDQSPLSDCSIRAHDHEVAVAIELRDDSCGTFGPYGAHVLLTFVPAEPLRPGRRYTLDCQGAEEPWIFTTREDDDPAAPPEQVVVASAVHTQEDEDGCCGGGDRLELKFAGHPAAYVAEGGRIEAVYPDGRIFAIIAERSFEADYEDVDAIFPLTDGPIDLTPVAADGRRGPTTRLAPADIRRQAVYVPCTVAPRGSPLALWLLVPFVWMHAHRRRRRG